MTDGGLSGDKLAGGKPPAFVIPALESFLPGVLTYFSPGVDTYIFKLTFKDRQPVFLQNYNMRSDTCL